MESTTQLRPQTTLTLVAVGCIFGSSFLLVKLLVANLAPAQLTAWRLLFGGVAVTAMLAWRGDVRLPGRSLLFQIDRARTARQCDPKHAVGVVTDPHRQQHCGGADLDDAGFTVLFAMALPRSEQLSAGKVCGLAMGIAGVAVLVGVNAGDATAGPRTAHLAVVLAAMSNAAAVVYARGLLAQEDALQLSGLKLVIGAMIALAIVGVARGDAGVPQMGASAWCALIVLGVLSNGVGRTMYLSLIASAGSVRASLVAYIVPLVGVTLGWLVLGERVGTGTAAGAAMIVCGMAFVTLWSLSEMGLEYVRDTIRETRMPGVAPADGWLKVSKVDKIEEAIADLKLYGQEFGATVEGWPTERVRDVLHSRHYFHAMHFPRAFHMHPLNYALGLAAAAEAAGARIFEGTSALVDRPRRRAQARDDAEGARARKPHRARLQRPSRRFDAAGGRYAAAGLELSHHHRPAGAAPA